MTVATIGKRYQVVIPQKERNCLNLKPHTKVDIQLQNASLVVHPLKDNGWRGIGKDVKDGTDATDYVRKLRAEWISRL